MSAAEKLKALPVPFDLSEGHSTMLLLVDALPQIVAVVQAAETAVEYDPDYSNVNDPNPLAAALAALDEALGDVT